jgi:ABC-type dipeptide/oligopeptide/nickel transport system ATPase component
MRPNVVHLLCERVIVMRAREIVAQGVCGEVLSTRKADYARGLLATVPRPPTCCRARRRADHAPPRTPVLPGGDARMPHCRPPLRQKRPWFNVGKAQHINWKDCQFIQRADGYGFAGCGPLSIVAFPRQSQRRF